MLPFPKTKRLLLVVLDGWGHSDDKDHNAVYQARKPNFDRLIDECPSRLIDASQEAVGLPKGQMGNSEVGHLTMGSGRVSFQPLVKISRSITQGDFFLNEEIMKGLDLCRSKGGALHLLGLASKGGVHSHIEHLYALIGMGLRTGVERIRVHAITDGRDVPPNSSLNDIGELQEWIRANDPMNRVRIATIMGRFFAMDRDRRWERTEQAFQYYLVPMENQYSDPVKGVSDAYGRGETDEFISPIQMVDNKGMPVGLIEDRDTIVFFNFRPDRARQLTKAFIHPFFDGFIRSKVVKPYFVAMTDYDNSMYTHVAFPESPIDLSLGEVVARSGMRQLRIAETEKYAHVTFFFSGGREAPFKDEKRVLIPSPKVKTYDLKPEMSAYEVTERMEREMSEKSFDFGILNFANPDMVGHTGVMEAAVKAIETVDTCLGRVIASGLANGYHLMITADHGNAEKMWNREKNVPFTAHTINPVHLIYTGKGITRELKFRDGPGSLAEIAPTVLKQMELPKPFVMTGVPFT